MKKSPNPLLKDNWKIRRKVMFLALVWQCVCMSWILFRAVDTVLNQQAFIALIGASTSIVCAYVFGAVWDDHNKRQFIRAESVTESDEDCERPRYSRDEEMRPADDSGAGMPRPPDEPGESKS